MDKFTRKTSFEQWFTPISSTKLEELVETHHLNYYTKKLHITSFLKLLVFAQLNEIESLRAVSETLFSDDLQKATDLESISFSQLGRRLNQIPTDVFQQVFLDLVAQIHEKSQYEQRRKTTTPLKIIDSSTLPLNLNNHKWAEFRKTKSGIKLHLRLVYAEKGCSYPDNAVLTNAKEYCDCCHEPMVEFSSVLVREEAKFIPATLKRVQYFEHVYECRACKNDSLKKSQIKRGQAPKGAIQRSIAGPTVLAKLIYDKFAQYLPLYRQVNEWSRHGLLTNDKNLSNWVIRVATDWLQPVYELMKKRLIAKSVLHIDETFAQILKRSDGKPAQSNAYNWVARSVQNEGPVIILFKSALSRGRATLEDFIQGFKGTVICDGYSAYNHLPDVQFANCWAHVRRYWLKADSNNGRKGVQYCDQLFHIERKIKHLSPKERVKIRQQESKPIVDEFFEWVDHSPFFGKNALAKAADYTLNRKVALKRFLDNGYIAIDNNAAENAIRPNVIGRKNWLFSVSEAGAHSNAICLSLAETAKANGIDFYQYLVKLMTDLPNLPFQQQPEILERYLPWSEDIQATCRK